MKSHVKDWWVKNIHVFKSQSEQLDKVTELVLANKVLVTEGRDMFTQRYHILVALETEEPLEGSDRRDVMVFSGVVPSATAICGRTVTNALVLNDDRKRQMAVIVCMNCIKKVIRTELIGGRT